MTTPWRPPSHPPLAPNATPKPWAAEFVTATGEPEDPPRYWGSVNSRELVLGVPQGVHAPSNAKRFVSGEDALGAIGGLLDGWAERLCVRRIG